MSITANELRFGNVVIEKVLGECEVRQIGKEWAAVRKFGDTANYTIDINNLSPIPLDASVLERCGFRTWGHSKQISTLVVSDLMNLEFTRKSENSEDGFTIRWSDGIVEGEYADIPVPITSLHQLQNLYFSLTGKDLEYKP